MLVIRESQLDGMTEERVYGLVGRAARLMRRCWPDLCAGRSEGELAQKVRLGLDVGQQFEVSGDQALCNFLNVWFVMGENFPLEPGDDWARDLLLGSSDSAIERVDRLVAEAARRFSGRM